MNLTTQLRIILLLVGAAIWLGIYLLGKRRAASRTAAQAIDDDAVVDGWPQHEVAFAAGEELDEEALETPAYMRRQGQRDVRQDYEPRIAELDDIDPTCDDAPRLDIAVHNPRGAMRVAGDEFQETQRHATTAYTEPVYVENRYVEETYVEERVVPQFSARQEPHVSFDAALDVDTDVAATSAPQDAAHESPQMSVPEVAVPVVAEPVQGVYQTPMRAADHDAIKPSTPTPTLSEVVNQPAPLAASPQPPASATNANKQTNAARRKIIALRLSMPERVAGDQLLSLLQREQLQHGKFSIFHRLHNEQTVFSVASMVEPGTFDPAAMAQQQFPGVTLFMLLPGPLDGLIAYDQMLSCAQRLAHATGGSLQDERGSKLTVQSIERLREEVLDFQHLIGGVAAAH